MMVEGAGLTIGERLADIIDEEEDKSKSVSKMRFRLKEEMNKLEAMVLILREKRVSMMNVFMC